MIGAIIIAAGLGIVAGCLWADGISHTSYKEIEKCKRDDNS